MNSGLVTCLDPWSLGWAPINFVRYRCVLLSNFKPLHIFSKVGASILTCDVISVEVVGVETSGLKFLGRGLCVVILLVDCAEGHKVGSVHHG